MNNIELIKRIKKEFPNDEVSIKNGKIQIVGNNIYDYILIRLKWKYIVLQAEYQKFYLEYWIFKRALWKMKISSFIDEKILHKQWCSKHGYSCDGTDYYYRKTKIPKAVNASVNGIRYHSFFVSYKERIVTKCRAKKYSKYPNKGEEVIL